MKEGKVERQDLQPSYVLPVQLSLWTKQPLTDRV